MVGPEDKSYITDDDGNVVGLESYRDDGKVDVYYSDDGFETHSHDIYSSVDEFIDRVDNSFAGEGDTEGDVYSRDADEDFDDHPWEDRDGVL